MKGSIASGKLADIVFLDRDIFQKPPAELNQVKVFMMPVSGKVIYDGRP